MSVSMIPLEDIPTHDGTSESLPPILAEILASFARLGMIAIYKQRRRAQRAHRGNRSPSDTSILQNLLDILAYCEHASSIRKLFSTVHNAIDSLALHQAGDLLLNIDESLDPVDKLAASATEGRLQAGGSACLSLSDHAIEVVLSSPAHLAMILPSRTMSLPSLDALVQVLQHALRAAVLHQLVTVLQEVISQKSGWQVKPLPETVLSSTRALAHRLVDGQVTEFV